MSILTYGKGLYLNLCRMEFVEIKAYEFHRNNLMLYPDSGISMDEEIVLGDMIWSYNKAEL